jgi:hypothetical protein
VIGPAIVLAAVLAVLHVSIYVLIRGRTGGRLLFLLAAAFLGAWSGDAVGGRIGADPIRIGDFSVLAASVMAWAGIGIVAGFGLLGQNSPSERETQP